MSAESNLPFKDYVVRRLGQLDAAEEPLRAQLKAINDEKDQLRRAALAAGIEVDAPAGQTISAEVSLVEEGDTVKATGVVRSPRRLPEKTIKEAVLDILKPGPKGMTALEILAEINRRYGADYPRTSLSPQLSRLKVQGLIKRKGTVWRRVKPAVGEKPEAADPVLLEGNGPATSDKKGVFE